MEGEAVGDTQLNPGQESQGDPGQTAAGAAQQDAGSQDTMTLEQMQKKLESLTSDVGKERDRRKAAERALQERTQADQIKAAKTAEELEQLKQETQRDIAKMQRDADIRVAAAAQGIHEDFIRGADDGQMPMEDVLKVAKGRQEAMLKQHQDATGTINLQTGGNSPDGGGQRIWKASEVAAMTTAEFRKAEPEILKAQREGRYRAAE